MHLLAYNLIRALMWQAAQACATTFRGGKQARRVFEFIALGPTGMG
jgi:hypothetical protein